MNVARTAAEVLDAHTTLELECVDRMYLNAYVPILQTCGGAAWFFRKVRGKPVPSSALMAPMTRDFVAGIERFAEGAGVEVVKFGRRERKEERMREHLRRFPGGEGVLFVGKAQEKTKVVRSERRIHEPSGSHYVQLVPATAMVNHYYFYLVDDDFGPMFVKFCSYFPYTARLCVNGHEYVKRQLEKRGVAFEAADNSILSCADPALAQDLADSLTAERIDDLVLRGSGACRTRSRATTAPPASATRSPSCLPEFALTQVFDRPVQGRVFFEEVIRENLDLGRPDRAQLIFDRRIDRRTRTRNRLRVVTNGVVPSLLVDYKHSHIKQYYKGGRALRTETVINDVPSEGRASTFGVKRMLRNFDDLKTIGFAANRRLLGVQRISHDSPLGQETFDGLHRPAVVDDRRASALRFGDPRVQALLATLLVFRLLPEGFANREFREHVGPLLGPDAGAYGPGRATYDLGRLRLRGLIEKIPRTHRYRVTALGHRVALCYCRTHRRVLGPTLAAVADDHAPPELGRLVRRFDHNIERLWEGRKMAA